MKEIWKKVVGFNKYEVSNLGRVRSLYKDEIKKRIDVDLLEKY